MPGRRCWAVEGTSSYGAGLTAFLTGQGERVVEVCRPKRPPRRGARKSDALDAVRAAREILSSDRLIEPRSRGQREALRVLISTRASAVSARTAAINHLKALIGSAPESLRAELRGKTSDAQISYCAKLRDRPAQGLEHRATIRAMRSTAHRIQALKAEANELEPRHHTPRRRRSSRAGPATRRRRPQRRANPDQLVPPRQASLRSRVRQPRRRRTDPRLFRPDQPPPPQPRWRSSTQPGAAHHRPDPQPDRPRDPRLHHPTTG